MHRHRSRVETVFAPCAIALSRATAAQMHADQSQEACTNELIKTEALTDAAIAKQDQARYKPSHPCTTRI
jgi:hypothetical protein